MEYVLSFIGNQIISGAIQSKFSSSNSVSNSSNNGSKVGCIVLQISLETFYP